MCGIAGYVTGSDPRPVAAFQAAALRTFAHRGPDDAGWLTDREVGTGDTPGDPGRWGLLHRRLSILDLSAARPPADALRRTAGSPSSSTARSTTTVELREELERRAALLRDRSRDTEVLLAGLRALGRGVPDAAGRHVRLRDLGRATAAGCSWPATASGSSRSITRRAGGGFAFASEIKALRPVVSGRCGRADCSTTSATAGPTTAADAPRRRSPVAGRPLDGGRSRHRHADRAASLLGHRPRPPDGRLVPGGGGPRRASCSSTASGCTCGATCRSGRPCPGDRLVGHRGGHARRRAAGRPSHV